MYYRHWTRLTFLVLNKNGEMLVKGCKIPAERNQCKRVIVHHVTIVNQMYAACWKRAPSGSFQVFLSTKDKNVS